MHLLIRRRELLLLLPIAVGLLVLLAARTAARYSDEQIIAFNSSVNAFAAGDLDETQKQIQNSLQAYQSTNPVSDALNPGPNLETAARSYELLGLVSAAQQDGAGALQNFQSCISLVEDARYKRSVSAVAADAVDLVEMECRYDYELIANNSSSSSSSQSGSGKAGQAAQQAPQPANGDQPNLGSGTSTDSGL